MQKNGRGYAEKAYFCTQNFESIWQNKTQNKQKKDSKT